MKNIIPEPSPTQEHRGVAQPQAFFTLVFEGDLRAIKKNPHNTDTPFGRAVVAGVGNAFDEFDALVEVRDELLEALELAVAILEEADFRLGYAKGSLGQLEMAEAKAGAYAAIAKATQSPPSEQEQ
ncbi:MAG: hypothetical protein ACM3W4_01645 [Ignavibacteriales bacterium]